MQGHKGVIIIAGIVILAAGVGIWWWLHSSQPAAAAASAAPGSPAPGSGPALVSAPPPAPITLLPVAAPGPINTMASVPTPVASVAGNMSVPYDPRMDQVQSWANSALDAANLAQYNAQKGNFTQTDWNGLFDLVINQFMGGQPKTAARTSFWNSWRTTYHIDDGTYS